jgi:hypothetical protein
MYTTKNIYREMNTDKYLNPVMTLKRRLKDTSKPPINIILDRPDGVTERDWKTQIYLEYETYKEDPYWLEQNNYDLRIQMSELVDLTLNSLKSSKKKDTLLYGNTKKLLCLSYATNGSEPLLRMMNFVGNNNINFNIHMYNEKDIDIDKSQVSSDFTNKIIDTIVGLLYTNPYMCVYKKHTTSAPLTRKHSDRSDKLIKFKEYYINGEGMNVEIGADKLNSFITEPDKSINHYFMLFWDIEEHVIAGWIIFESILKDQPTSYSDVIHSSFDKYIHISSFCGNIPARSNGATTFIAMLMDLCKKNPTHYHGIILDSVIIIETILLYYSLGFRSVLYKDEYSIGNSNTTVYVDHEQLMVWNANPIGPYFPVDTYTIHPSTPSFNLDQGPRSHIVTFDNKSRWTFNNNKGEITLHDIRAFITIATKGFPLNPFTNGSPVDDAHRIHQTPLYTKFKEWMKANYAPSSRRITGKGGRAKSRRSRRSRRIKYWGGSEYLVPDEVYTKDSTIYKHYIEGTLYDPNNIYVKDDKTTLDGFDNTVTTMSV